MSCKNIFVYDIFSWVLYILSDGRDALSLLGSMPRKHKTTNRSVLIQLPSCNLSIYTLFSIRPFQSYIHFCFVALDFGLLTIFTCFSKLDLWCADFAGTLHFNLSLLGWILEASIFCSDFFLSKLRLRHIGAIARKEFALQVSSRVFVCMAWKNRA